MEENKYEGVPEPADSIQDGDGLQRLEGTIENRPISTYLVASLRKTYDNIRIGTVLLLGFQKEGEDVSFILPLELSWLSKWVVIKIIDNDTLLIRSLEVRRDIVVCRKGLVFKGKRGDGDHVFVVTNERQLLIPDKRESGKSKITTVRIKDLDAYKFITKRTGVRVVDLVVEAIERKTMRVLNLMASEVYLEYNEKTGRTPTFFPVFNSIISTDPAFLQALKDKFGGILIMTEMRWIAFGSPLNKSSHPRNSTKKRDL